MKNLKKVLAFVMVFTMMLSVAVSAGTLYPDVDDNASYVEALATLKALGVMEGDDKGNFNPEASIIRAETAAIVARVRALNNVAAGASRFTDVADDHWAVGYINSAEQTGIINGYGDGNFGPSDPVTYEQVIKMIVAALGYTPKAEAEGGYPSGYMTIASQEDILKGVSIAPGEAAPRSAVARLVFNALEVKMMEQVGYKPGQEEYEPGDKTLLKNYLKVDKYEGIVTDTYATKVGDVEDDDITIDVVRANGVSVDAKDYDGIKGETKFAEGATDATGFLGMSVAAYAKEDEVTNEMTLVGIAAKANRNEVLTIEVADYVGSYKEAVVADADKKIDAANGEFKYEDEDGDELLVEVAPGYKVFKNGGKSKDTLDKIFATKNGTLTLISNDTDDAYEYAFVTNYDGSKNQVIGEINASVKTLKDIEGNPIYLYLNNDSYRTVFYLDGAQIAFEDLKVDDVLTIASDDSGKLLTVYVSRNIVEGSIESTFVKNGETVYVIGEDEFRADASATVAIGAEGKFYINFAGKIAHAEAVTTANYGFLYNAYKGTAEDGFSTAVNVVFLAMDGTWKTAALANKITFNGKADTETANGIATYFEGSDASNSSYFKTIKQGVIKYNTKADGTINELSYVTADASEKGEFKQNTNSIKGIWLTEETPVFSVPATLHTSTASAVEKENKDDYKVSKAASMFVDKTDYTVEAYDVDFYPEVVVAYGAEAAIHDGQSILLVTSTAKVRNEEGTTITKIYGYQDGEEVEALLSEDGVDILDKKSVDTGSDYAPTVGDVIIFSLDADNAIDKVKVLFTNADAAVVDGAATLKKGVEVGEESKIYFAHANDYKKGILMLGEGYKVDGKAYKKTALLDGGAQVALRIAGVDANFYEVNANRKDFVATNDFNESLISTAVEENNDTHWVLVREYDGVVTDVVAYRYEVAEISVTEA